MEKHEVEPVLEKVSAEVADFIVGFVLLSVQDGIEDAEPKGSGTLVTVGPVHGILTAAHVLRKLPDHGQVGIVRSKAASWFAQKQTINMEHAEKLTIAGESFGSQGPDLGFLQLPQHDAAVLEARGVFFNLGKRRASVLAGDQPGKQYFDGISGTVAEWTTDLPSERGFHRVKGFRSLYGVGNVIGERESDGFDLLDFEVSYDSDFKSPASYEGMSGGALWRAYCTTGDDGQLSLSSKLVFGVAFHQSGISEGKRIITCHGPRSVYGPLIDAIRDKWSE